MYIYIYIERERERDHGIEVLQMRFRIQLMRQHGIMYPLEPAAGRSSANPRSLHLFGKG